MLIPSSGVKVCKRGEIDGQVVSIRRHGSYFRTCIKVGKHKLYTLTPVPLSEGERVGVRVDKAIVVG